jgi:peptidoglycan-N-acetylglucosamine deacetylase
VKRIFIHKLQIVIKRNVSVSALQHLVVSFAILVLALQIALVGINSLNSGHPILGLRFEGRTVGQIGGDFHKQIDTIVSSRENKVLSIKVANETSTITRSSLGQNTDKNKVSVSLLRVGRAGNVLSMVFDQDRSALGILNLSLEQSPINRDLAKAYITTLDRKIDVSPINAYFAFDQQKAIVHPDKNGTVIDSDAAIRQLSNLDPEGSSQIILPTTYTYATVTKALLDPLLPQVQAIAKKTFTIIAGSTRVSLSPEQLVTLIVPKVFSDTKHSGQLTAQVSFDEDKLNALIDGVLKQATFEPQPTIMNGSVVVRQGKNGIEAADGNSMTSVLTALIDRQTGVAFPDTVQIQLIAVNPSIVQQMTNNVRSRTGTGLVRLTFDDGPGAYTETILDILKRYNVHATFYVIGRNVQHHPQTIQRILREGHSIGNHSFTHSDLTRLSAAGVKQELANTQSAIQQAGGANATAFRPPYGSVNQVVRQVAASMGLSVDLWSVDPRDWSQPGSGAIVQRVLSGDGPGAVILLHVLHQQTVDALPAIIEGIRAQGYTME